MVRMHGWVAQGAWVAQTISMVPTIEALRMGLGVRLSIRRWQ